MTVIEHTLDDMPEELLPLLVQWARDQLDSTYQGAGI